MKVCDYNHLILYAKGHYERGNLLEDMRKIVAERCALLEEHVSTSDIWHICAAALMKHCDKHVQERVFTALFEPRVEETLGFASGPKTVPSIVCPLERAVRNVLSELCHLVVRELKLEAGAKPMSERVDSDYEIMLELGRPDPNVLPLNKPVKNGAVQRSKAAVV